MLMIVLTCNHDISSICLLDISGQAVVGVVEEASLRVDYWSKRFYLLAPNAGRTCREAWAVSD